jgi:hypothetical protein
MKQQIRDKVGIHGGWLQDQRVQSSIWTLAYAKADSIQLLKYMYYNDAAAHLSRKYNIAKNFLGE